MDSTMAARSERDHARNTHAEFLPGGVSPAPDILGGDAEKQIRAIRDVVMTLGKKKIRPV